MNTDADKQTDLCPTSLESLRRIIGRGRKSYQGFMVCFFTMLFWWLPLWMLQRMHILELSEYEVGGVVIGIVGLSAIFSAIIVINGSLFEQAVDELTTSEDVQVVGLLAENFLSPLAKQGYTANQILRGRKALLRLLPQMQPDDAFLLTSRQRECLYRVLTKNDVPMILAVLKALEQIGDRQAIFHVGRLLTGNYPPSDNAEVREAATHCLPLLYERLNQQKSAQVLLRPSALQEPAAEVLLRAAASTEDAPAEQLLRATSGSEAA